MPPRQPSSRKRSPSGRERADAADPSATRTGIVRAAQEELLLYGLRKTSMEGIARAAGVSKATLYAYFADKAAVFDAVCAAVSERLTGEVQRAAERAPAPPAAVARSLGTKFRTIWRLAHSSPHGAELLQAALQATTPETRAAHERYVEELASLLVACPGVAPEQAGELAEVLDCAAEGITLKASSEAQLGRRLELLVAQLFPEGAERA